MRDNKNMLWCLAVFGVTLLFSSARALAPVKNDLKTNKSSDIVLAPEVASAPPEIARPDSPKSQVASVPARAKSLPADANRFVEVEKPKIEEKFKSIMYEFSKDGPPNQKMCDDVVNEMYQHEATVHPGRILSIVLSMVTPEVDENGQEMVDASEAVVIDKNVNIALEELNEKMTDRDASQIFDGSPMDLSSFMKDIVECRVDDFHHTIVERLVELGLETSLKSAFTQHLLRGTHDYNPLTHKDSSGNNLMHLSVKSGADSIPRVISSLVDRTFLETWGNSSQGIMSNVWWFLSCLTNDNDAGLNPLKACANGVVADAIKKQFRIYTTYVKYKNRQLMRTSPKEYKQAKEQLRMAEDALKTSLTAVPLPEVKSMPPKVESQE